jgi:hypothetical protein
VNDTSVSFEINDVREAPGLNVMSGSSEISDTWDAPAAARVATPVMVERPKSARQALRCLLIKMFAFIDERDVSVETFHLKKIYIPLSNLREPYGGRACTSSHSQRQPAEHNVSRVLWGGSRSDEQA